MYPILFKIGNFPIRTYSLFLLLAFVVGMLVLRYLLKRRTLVDYQLVTDLAFWVIIGVVIGSRLLFVLLHWSDFASQPLRALNIMEGGAVYYGGFLLGFVFGAVFVWLKKLPAFPMLDAIAPAIALGEGIGRIGCFFNGCCFGKPTDFCGITFPPGSYAAQTYGDVHSIWPTQLFQSGGGILLFVILILVLRFVTLRKGQLFSLFLVGFGALRFGVNFLRWYDPVSDLWVNQIIASVLFLAGAVLFFVTQKTQEEIPEVAWIAQERKRLAEAAEKKERKKKKKSRR
ncbi:prolipoprotein diacylglyceryl transferase [candidate division WOR-3 bacterium]|nr:prolipoprotein diacylglyceryl transferase [candidate division WOR-3 bacterium]